MKGIIEDRIFGIGKYLTTENDPLMNNLAGFDKMIDHFVKNAQGNYNFLSYLRFLNLIF